MKREEKLLEIFGSLLSRNLTEEQKAECLLTFFESVPYNIFYGEFAILFAFVRFCYVSGITTEAEYFYALKQNTPAAEIVATLSTESRNTYNEYKGSGMWEEAGEILQEKWAIASHYRNNLTEEENPKHGKEFEEILAEYLTSWKSEKAEIMKRNMKEIEEKGKKIKGKTYKGATGLATYKKDNAELLDYLGAKGQEIKQIRADEFTGLSGLDLLKELKQEPKGGTVLASYGSSTLDDLTGGGLKRFQLVTIQATSGGGKTRYGVNLGASSLVKGKNVLHISLEMTKNFMLACYISRLVKEINPKATGATDSEITDPGKQLTPKATQDVCKAVDLMNSETAGKLKIVTPERIDPKGSHSLENYLKNIYKDFKFDVIILDYLGECVNSSDNLYQDLRAIAQSFGKLAKSWDNGKGFLGICLNQLNSAGALQAEQGKTDGLAHLGAGTRALLEVSDVLLTINQTKEQRTKNITGFSIGKLRAGKIPAKDNINFKTEMGYSYFHQ